MLKQKYFLADFFILSAEKQPIKSSWRKIVCLHNIGRHWEAGPQREFYLPECWLNFGKDKKNVLVLGLRQTANGAVIKAMEIAPYRGAAEMKE